MNRHDTLVEIARIIAAVNCAHPIRVAIDGVDASGKTTLADNLVRAVSDEGFKVIRASVDSFQFPQSIRRQRGSLSPEGYYYDAFDYGTLKTYLLEPLGDGGSRRYCTQAFDLRHNRPIEPVWQQADERSVLLVDGVFLQRPEIMSYWDVRVWVDVPFELALERACVRDLAVFESVEIVRERYLKRYIPGQMLYFECCHPKSTAQYVVENSDPLNPILYRTAS